jgi:hypothetical protein
MRSPRVAGDPSQNRAVLREAHRSAEGATLFARRGCLWAALWLACGTAVGQLPTEPPNPAAAATLRDTPLAGPELHKLLRHGGLVIYFRHTATDFSRRDDAMKDYGDCSNQRLLSSQGRVDATRVGRLIRTLKLPIDEVLASPMCRTMDHAKLAFGHATPTPALREANGGDYPGLKQLLVKPVLQGRIRWIVGHGIPFRVVTGAPQLAEGEAVVIRPDSTSWTLLARITVDQWEMLAPPR